MSGSHDGGFTCAQVDEGSQHMAASISILREELRGEREKYRQVVEINNANERAYLANIDKLRAELPAALLAYDVEVIERREELTRLHQELGQLRAELGAVVLACDSIPDVTISKWACDPGGHWNRVREALRARRAAQGFDVDAADPETAFDEHGWLKQRKAGDSA